MILTIRLMMMIIFFCSLLLLSLYSACDSRNDNDHHCNEHDVDYVCAIQKMFDYDYLETRTHHVMASYDIIRLCQER